MSACACVRASAREAFYTTRAPVHGECETVAAGTSFEEMNHELGRSQTTRGVWLAKAAKPEGFPTLVMDLEGTDGRERQGGGGLMRLEGHIQFNRSVLFECLQTCTGKMGQVDV